MPTYYSKNPHRPFDQAHSRFKQATVNQIIWNAWKLECEIVGRHNPELAEETEELSYQHYKSFREFADLQEHLHELVISQKGFVW